MMSAGCSVALCMSHRTRAVGERERWVRARSTHMAHMHMHMHMYMCMCMCMCMCMRMCM